MGDAVVCGERERQCAAALILPVRQIPESPPSLSEEHLAVLQSAFDLFDVDKDGHITAEEVQHILSLLGQSTTLEEARDLVHQVDSDENGTIEFSEFLAMMASHSVGPEQGPSFESDEDFHHIFEMFDLNRDGLLDAQELMDAMERIGERITLEQCHSMIREADLDGDGNINFEEFCTILRRAL